ncbi:MAG: hypothetical protein ACTHMM_14120 [Agriterribacter sp.]
MKNTFICLNIFLILLTGCSKSDNDTQFSLKKLPQAVQDEISANTPDCNVCGLAVKLCKFRGEKIYEVYVTSPVCNGIIVYYDLKGNKHSVTPDIFSEYMETRQVIETIWSCTP